MNYIEGLKNYCFIVVGEEHYTPLGVIRSLGEVGIKPIAIILKPQSKWGTRIASVSKYIKKLYQISSYDEVFPILKKYKSESKKVFIIPCDDIVVATLDKKYDLLKKYFYIGNAGYSNRIAYYEQKQVIYEIARRNGFRVARTWNLEDDKLPEDIEYPVITKPFESYKDWKSDYYICHSQDELKDALRKVKGEVFVQQYVEKDNELCLDGVVVNNGKDLFISIASKYTYILPDYYSMEMYVSNFDNSDLKKCFENIFSEIGFEGIFSSEFLIDKNGDLWFLEINFRNSTWSYASTSAGMNLPCLWAYGMLHKKLPDDIYRKIPDGYIALAEVPDFEKRVRKYKLISVKDWIKHVKSADVLFYYNKNDKRPAIRVWLKKLKNIIVKKLGNIFHSQNQEEEA